MKLRVLLLVAAGLLVAAEDPKADAKKDKENIQGAWKAVSGEAGGQKLSDERIESIKIVIAADKITVNVADNTRVSTYKIDPAQKPKTIDLTNEMDQTAPGIYELDGDNLKLCFPSDEESGALPKEFTGKQGSNQMLLVFKRAK